MKWALPALLLFGLLANVLLDSFVQFLIVVVMINMVLGISLNLVNGFTGQFSLGHAGFMAVGAYVSAYLAEIWHHSFGALTGPLQLPGFILFGVAGGLAAAGAGWLVGLPSLRLRGDYLAIVTLGFSEIIRVILLNTSAVGGARGFYGIKGPEDWDLGPFTISRFLLCYAIALFWLLVCFITVWRLIRSAHGRSFMSVRDDEVAAESIGVDTTRTKVRAFVLSSFFAGAAGSVFAHFMAYLNPSSFAFNRSVDAIIIVVLGGMGSITGSLLAATLVTIVPELLRPLQELTGVDFRMVIYSALLVLMMILRPQGFMGSTELPDFLRKYARKSA